MQNSSGSHHVERISAREMLRQAEECLARNAGVNEGFRRETEARIRILRERVEREEST